MNKIIENNLWDVMCVDENKKAFIKEMINFVINNLKDAFGYCCRNKLSLREYCPKERFGGSINQATVFASVRLAEMWENGCYESLRNLFGMREIDIENVKRWTTSDGDFIIFNEIWELKTSQAKDSWTGATHSSHKSRNYILINFTLNCDLKLGLITPPEFIPQFSVYLVKFPENIEINEIWKGKPTNKNSFTTFRIRNDWIQQGYVRKLHGDLLVSPKNKYAKILHDKNPLIQ